MPTIPLPILPPIPWPVRPPGVGIPIPNPTPSPGIPTPSPTIPFPSPVAVSSGFGGVTGPFSDLFTFTPDWEFWGALLVVTLSVGFVEEQYPEYVWIYVGILLLGLILKLAGFTPNLNRLIGR